jgi:Fe-S cluster assembly protein SufD
MNLQEISKQTEKKLETFPDGPLKKFRLSALNKLKSQEEKLDPEAYKFTNIFKFLAEIDLNQKVNKSTPVIASETIVLEDGVIKQKPSLNGVIVRELDDSEFLELSQNSPLSQLHHGLMNGGVVIEIAKGIELDTPLRIEHRITNQNVLAPTVFIKLSPFSKASVLETTSNLDSNYAQFSETYVNLEAGAWLEHLQLDRGTINSLHHASTSVKVRKDACYKNFIFHLSGKLLRRNLDLALLEEGANGESYNLYLTSQKDQSDINTEINHLAADTTSNQIAKGILGDESRGIFTGKIHIHPKAQRVVSGQLNKNLLLSKKAQVHSQPQLEIFADDVKCSHGSTTGQLSPEEIFYFEARGIPAEKARNLLSFGFALEIVQKIENIFLKNELSSLVMTSLKEKFHLGREL